MGYKEMIIDIYKGVNTIYSMVTIIQVNVSDAQKELIQKEAERNSLSCSSFVRTLVLSKIRNAYPQSDFEKNLSQENRETIKLKNDLGVFG